MFTHFFNLKFNPFTKEIPADKLFPSKDLIELDSRLKYLQNTRGIGLVIGEAGTGKSTALRRYVKSFNPALFKYCYFPLSKKIGFGNINKELGNLYLIDFSIISLCIFKYPWAEFRKTKSGIKFHLRLRFCDEGSVSDQAVITPVKLADKIKLNDLIVEEEDSLNIFDNTDKVMKFIVEEISKDTMVNIMAQYYPAHKAHDFPELSRRINKKEYIEAVQYAKKLGFS